MEKLMPKYDFVVIGASDSLGSVSLIGTRKVYKIELVSLYSSYGAYPSFTLTMELGLIREVAGSTYAQAMEQLTHDWKYDA